MLVTVKNCELKKTNFNKEVKRRILSTCQENFVDSFCALTSNTKEPMSLTNIIMSSSYL